MQLVIAVLGLLGGIVCGVGVQLLKQYRQRLVNEGVHIYDIHVFAVNSLQQCADLVVRPVKNQSLYLAVLFFPEMNHYLASDYEAYYEYGESQ